MNHPYGRWLLNKLRSENQVAYKPVAYKKAYRYKC